MKPLSNKNLSKLLKNISAAYMVKNGPYFKIIAYQNAADSVEHATSEAYDLWKEGSLDKIPGLGASIQKHIDELFKTGKVKHFEELMHDLPKGMFEFLNIGGIGPKSAYKLAKSLKLESVPDLEKAAQSHRIRDLEGFGAKSEEDILKSLSEFKVKEVDRHLLPFAFETAERILEYLRSFKECERAEPLGSLRRMVATVGDVDIAVATKNPDFIINKFKNYKEVSRVLGAGTFSSSVMLTNGMQADLKVQPPDAFGSLLQHFTGSKNHNVKLREFSLKKGMSLSEHGIKKDGKIKRFKTEESFYKELGLDWIEPELREDTGELEAAKEHSLPKLTSLDDILGDIHIHSNYSIEPSHDLGQDSFKVLIEKATQLKYEYIGLSDHSPGFSTHTKSKIIDLIKKRTDIIEQLKNSYKNIRILNLLEIDILANVELSVPEEGLKLLDGSIAGIHSSHTQDKRTITKRLLLACNSPYVQVISHPTGRLLNQRQSYEADWDKVFEACKKTGTILEINAWPNRLDLPDTLVKEAIGAGVKLIINSDAHEVSQMDNMKYGVSVARRGWAQNEDIVNTWPWSKFAKLFNVRYN